MDHLELLISSGLLPDSERRELEALRPAIHLKKFANGAVIWRAGERVTALHVIVTGLVEVGHTAEDGSMRVVAIFPDGYLLGGYQLFEERAHEYYDAVALRPTTCLVLDRDALLDFLDRSPRLMRHVAALLLRRLMNLQKLHVETHGAGDVPHRVERCLTWLALSGERVASGVRIMPLSQSALAGLVGASREAVNRALRHMADQGLVQVDDGRITVRKVASRR